MLETKLAKMGEKLSTLGIESLSWEHQFFLRRNRGKYSASAFVLGFFCMMLSNQHSLSCWAQKIGILSGIRLSKQGLFQRLNKRAMKFCQSLLLASLRENVLREKGLYCSALFSFFSHVYLEDSTCFALPKKLATSFPGAHSRGGKTAATARIQLCMDLLSDQYSSLHIQSYRDNDQKHATAIVSQLQPKDLLLRDLGYWSLEAMDLIIQEQAYLVSRYKYGVHLFDARSKEKIELGAWLKQLFTQGKSKFERAVLVGKRQQLPLRLIVLRTPAQMAQKRRRKAKANRNQKANHSTNYMQLLDWTILLTNVPQKVWNPEQVLQAYGYRWRIEIVFKAWKSQLKIHQLFEGKNSMSHERVYISFYLALLWCSLFLTPWIVFFQQALWKKKQKHLSLLKFTLFAKDRFIEILLDQNLELWVDWVAYYCAYDKKIKTQNQIQTLMENP